MWAHLGCGAVRAVAHYPPDGFPSSSTVVLTPPHPSALATLPSSGQSDSRPLGLLHQLLLPSIFAPTRAYRTQAIRLNSRLLFFYRVLARHAGPENIPKWKEIRGHRETPTPLAGPSIKGHAQLFNTPNHE
jgi:hypothetical protein